MKREEDLHICDTELKRYYEEARDRAQKNLPRGERATQFGEIEAVGCTDAHAVE